MNLTKIESIEEIKEVEEILLIWDGYDWHLDSVQLMPAGQRFMEYGTNPTHYTTLEEPVD